MTYNHDVQENMNVDIPPLSVTRSPYGYKGVLYPRVIHVVQHIINDVFKLTTPTPCCYSKDREGGGRSFGSHPFEKLKVPLPKHINSIFKNKPIPTFNFKVFLLNSIPRYLDFLGRGISFI